MVHVFPTAEATTLALARRFADYLTKKSGPLGVVLPGGSTPKQLYKVLAQSFHEGVPWDRIHWVLSDERCVPPDHGDSNFGMVWDTLWSPRGVDSQAITRFRGEIPSKEAVSQANTELEYWAKSDFQIDLVLLGMGEDAHTASLFPSSQEHSWGTFPVAEVFHPQKGTRLTLVPEALSKSNTIWIFALGKNKAQAIHDTISSTEKTPMLPITLLNAPNTEWFLDYDAAHVMLEHQS
jgi:6-phosphogluconolactonase